MNFSGKRKDNIKNASLNIDENQVKQVHVVRFVGVLPECFENYFTLNFEIHQCSTCKYILHYIHIYICLNTTRGQFLLLYCGAELWNSHQHLVNISPSPSLSIFKYNLKQFLVSSYSKRVTTV